jgi:hypothetical protein
VSFLPSRLQRVAEARNKEKRKKKKEKKKKRKKDRTMIGESVKLKMAREK